MFLDVKSSVCVISTARSWGRVERRDVGGLLGKLFFDAKHNFSSLLK